MESDYGNTPTKPPPRTQGTYRIYVVSPHSISKSITKRAQSCPITSQPDLKIKSYVALGAGEPGLREEEAGASTDPGLRPGRGRAGTCSPVCPDQLLQDRRHGEDSAFENGHLFGKGNLQFPNVCNTSNIQTEKTWG